MKRQEKRTERKPGWLILAPSQVEAKRNQLVIAILVWGQGTEVHPGPTGQPRTAGILLPQLLRTDGLADGLAGPLD